MSDILDLFDYEIEKCPNCGEWVRANEEYIPSFECTSCGKEWRSSETDDEAWRKEYEQVNELIENLLDAESDKDYENLTYKIRCLIDTFEYKVHVAKSYDISALCQYFLNNYDDCISTIKESLNIMPCKEGYGIIGVAMSHKDSDTAEFAYNAMINLSVFLGSNSSSIYLDEKAYKDAFAKMSDVYSKHFNEIPAERRKYVTIVDDISICKEDVLPLRICDIPSGFIFPGGKPITGVLYVANPVKPHIYYRAEDYELSTFRDQLDDFLLVLSSLGAKKLSFYDSRTSEMTNDDRNSVGVSGKGNYLAYSGSAGVNVDRHSKAYQKLCNEYFREMEFDISLNKPSKPTTPWFEVMSDWQALAHQRLDLGTAFKDHRRIALSESATLQEETKIKVDAEFKSMKASLGIDVGIEKNSIFSENYDLCWEYDVEFYHLNEYDNLQLQTSQSVNHVKLNRNEQEYIAEYKASMVNGEISSGERRLLGRLAQKLGISPERVKELEASLSTPRFTDDENDSHIRIELNEMRERCRELYHQWNAEFENVTDINAHTEKYIKLMESEKLIPSDKGMYEAIIYYCSMSYPGVDNSKMYNLALEAIDYSIEFDESMEINPIEQKLYKGLIAFEGVYYDEIPFSADKKQLFFDGLKLLENCDDDVFSYLDKDYYINEYNHCKEYFDNPDEFLKQYYEDEEPTEEEKEYIDEYNFMLEEGEISERERKTLERRREKLGITPLRACELEAMVSKPLYTPAEKEYLEEYKLTLEDGEIGQRERKYLERRASKLGISSDRTKEIESKVKSDKC